MDGFDQDEAAGERDKRPVIFRGLLASQGDAFESLQPAHRLLDASACFVKRFRKELGLFLGIRAMWNDRADAAVAGGLPVGLGVVPFVGDHRAGSYIGSDVERGLELAAVAGLSASQVEVERQALEVAFEMDLGREPAARPAERLTVLPPFAPAAETWARTTVLSSIWTMCAVSLRSANN